MDEIRKNRDLVKTMVDEYIDKITIFRLHELWLLVVVSYKMCIRDRDEGDGD